MKVLTKINSNSNLVKAVALANLVLKSETFKHKLRMFKDNTNGNTLFAYSNGVSGDTMVKIIEAFQSDESFTIEVCLYRTKWPWSKALAMFDANQPFKVFLNERNINRNVDSLVGSIVHEVIHLLDHHERKFSFGHGSNKYTADKDYSAPYFIGSLAKSVVGREFN